MIAATEAEYHSNAGSRNGRAMGCLFVNNVEKLTALERYRTVSAATLWHGAVITTCFPEYKSGRSRDVNSVLDVLSSSLLVVPDVTSRRVRVLWAKLGWYSCQNVYALGVTQAPFLIHCPKYSRQQWWFFYAVYIGSILQFLQTFLSSSVQHSTN